ncbi:MAG TPA: dihydrolipoamide acetyltransferase family protein, partial [Gaiellaceae bacterium]
MANEVKLPRLGQGMEAGTVTRWLKSEGDAVAKGEPLYEIDTDKVTQEVESDFEGVLLKITLPEGEAPVGQTIAWIGEAGEEVAAPAPAAAAPETQVPGTKVPGTSSTPQARVPGISSANGGRVKASPLARRLARERGIDLGTLRGTGPDGRIVAEDVERGAAAAPATPTPTVPAPTGEVESIPLTNVRKTIARRLTAAWQAPVFQLTVSADMTRANELVAKARALEPDVRITVTDVLAKVCAAALRRHRDVNVAFADDALLRFPTANIGIAVAAPQGLVVPVIASVETRSLADVARARGEVVERARANKLTAADLDGGTFTISNLGMYGVEHFVAVLNPPQAAILAVGATEDRPVVVEGEVVVRPMMTMTLTVDHRAVDGAEGAGF